jgi:hypothetical protein
MNDDYRRTLEIQPPLATCGHCHFATALDGKWAVEDGCLVFRAAPDPLTRRRPGLESCSESREIAEFEFIEAGGERLPAADVETLRATARASRGWDERA